MSERQYAYRAGRSTTDLVREVVWRMVSAREATRQVAVVCCDLSRAFDTADHALISSKLQHYGISGPALALLMSFMSDRVQLVVGDGGAVQSSEANNCLGVPQGSCLSNTLFSILLNDLPLAIQEHEVFMYADDVTAVVTAATADELECELNKTVQTLHDWFSTNGLSLNKDKTCFMRISLNGHPLPQMKVQAAGAGLQQVGSTKLLGFYLDSALVWDHHIDELCKRLGRSCFALRRLASTASADVVRSCYFATVHSLLTYGTELWARASEWRRVFSMQKRAVRAMANVPDDVSARKYFKELGIMPLPCLWVYNVAVITHINREKFKRRGTNPTWLLRSNKYKDRLVVPFHKLAKSEQSVWVCGATVYNRLPLDVRNATTITSFKYKVKKFLLERQYYDYKEYF